MSAINKKFYFFSFLLFYYINTVYAVDCRMWVEAKNETGATVMAAIFNEKDEKLSVLTLNPGGAAYFTELCPSQYRVIFKDGNKFTESEIVNIIYTTTVVGNRTTNSWSNGNVKYFTTRTGGSGKPAADKYKF